MRWVSAQFLLSLVLAKLPVGPITPHFEDWLNRNNYTDYNFARHDLNNTGSYGGKMSDSQIVNNFPIIFFHGNSDGALKIEGRYSSGSSLQIEYFESMGFTSAELFVTTWGNRETTEAAYQAHNCSTITRLRKFVEAVISYTKSEKVNLIAHSMGVTLARKVAKGGHIEELDGNSMCNIGEPLTDVVNVFIGIAGANYGMCSCFAPTYTCNDVNGFFPGDSSTQNCAKQCGNLNVSPSCVPQNYSKFLRNMNDDNIREGKHVHVFWTKQDEILKPCDVVWGRPTSRTPTQDSEFIFESQSL